MLVTLFIIHIKNFEKLDKAVKAAYGNKGFETEEEIIASLMKLYKEAVYEESYCKDFTSKDRKSAI